MLAVWAFGRGGPRQAARIASMSGCDAEDGDHPLQIVGENVEAHLGSDLFQVRSLKWVAPIQALSVPKGCSAVAASDAHGLGRAVQPFLHGVDDGFVLPARDPPLLGRRALRLSARSRRICVVQ